MENIVEVLYIPFIISLAYAFIKSKHHIASRKKKRAAEKLGKAGEKLVDKALSVLSDDYILLNNLLLLYNNSTHQIDHVIISEFGIFIIETKNYSGIVKGTEKSRTWVHFMGRKRYYFLNPIIQNNGHVEALKAHFPEYADYFIPIVCFTDKTKLDVKTDSIVINLERLIWTIKNYRTEILIPDIMEVAQNLRNLSLEMPGAMKHHIDNIRHKKSI